MTPKQHAQRKHPRRSSTLSSASAYYRLAAKAGRAGNYVAAEHYTKIADRKINEHNRQKESMEAWLKAHRKASNAIDKQSR